MRAKHYSIAEFEIWAKRKDCETATMLPMAPRPVVIEKVIGTLPEVQEYLKLVKVSEPTAHLELAL